MEFYAGVAKEKITPELGTLLFGYPTIRKAEHVHDDLYATAIAFKQNNETFVIISCDTSVITKELYDKISSKLSAETDVLSQNVFCCATHTHSAPCPGTYVGWGGG
ncbi:MAG: hypothetical protein E7393_06030 [Ruminococcaceae bacterium]|nr:hypothetical protein [Oscillospiraceae bacterium]